jgi:uncharacterized protein YdeI (YjbR/CyaY-like superfamily)
LIALIKEAMALNEADVRLPQKPKTTGKKELEVPDWFLDAIRSNPKAFETWENFSYSHRKEYLEWVTEARREETRSERLNKMLEQLQEGKSRNW